MARQCAICGKTGIMRSKRKKLMSQYNPTPKKRKYPNLQWVTLPSGVRRDKSLLTPSLRSGKRVKACAKCIKSLGKK